MTIDIIIPVYNRPAEIEAIFGSLARQSDMGFGVVVVEDGSSRDCAAEVERFRDRLNISYLRKENGGPAAARNFGTAHSKADFYVFFDSDVIVPPGYIATVRKALEGGMEFYGGPDMADPAFSAMERAVSYAMTSPFTTGGIRGGRRAMEHFTPRSFNMGIARRLFEAVGGFSADMRYGEDIDLSLRVAKAVEAERTNRAKADAAAAGMGDGTTGARGTHKTSGQGAATEVVGTHKTGALLREAGVYHRRRTGMRAFFRQVRHSGAARVDLARRHPGSLKAVHLLPMLFVFACIACVTLALVGGWYFIVPVAAVCLVWFVDSSLRNRNVWVGLLSVVTSMVQLWGYGTGMLVRLLSAPR